MSASATNARSSAMPPPPDNKKRKTLAERAGEPLRPAPVAPGSRVPNAGAKAKSSSTVSRQTSASSSVSSIRPPSASSLRNVSNSSYGSSVGSAPSSQYSRPQSAIGNPRVQRPLHNPSRSATAMDTHSAGRFVGSRKGMPQFFLDANETPKRPLQRQRNVSYDSGMSYCSGWESRPHPVPHRDASLVTAMRQLNLNGEEPKLALRPPSEAPSTPSQIPKLVQSVPSLVKTPSPTKTPRKSVKPSKRFLTRDSNTEAAWDADARLEEVESICSEFKERIESATTDSNSLKDTIADYKARIQELNTAKEQLQSSNSTLQTNLEIAKAQLISSSVSLEDSKRYHHITLDDLHRQHRRDLEDKEREKNEELRLKVMKYQEESQDMKRQWEHALEDERVRRQKEVESLTSEGAMTQRNAEMEVEKQRRLVESVQEELNQVQADVRRERLLNNDLRSQLSEAAANALKLETSMSSLRAHIAFLESDNKSQSQAFADLEMRMQNAIRSAAEANEKLRIEETLRRKLHNQVQELKGNIRVFCRVRPPLEADSEAAKIKYPDRESDSKEVEVLGQPEKSSLGSVTTKTNAFCFDRVFSPSSVNADVFDEISQLVQSALDGYNVCIFCYGQTGSGKTFTMSAEDGMIPRAVHQIYDTAKSLEEKGWRYCMEGSFVEVYNENLNDLLGKSDELDKKKHEIRHDMQRCKTTITGATVVELDAPDKVENILQRAMANRSVAATKANERSSRSHSVFILRLNGENSVTGEKSEGTLNLVDLAGSERLSHSGATGERLKETQSINKSLSCLGDVIGALGQGKEGGHVPYRNSKVSITLGGARVNRCALRPMCLTIQAVDTFIANVAGGQLKDAHVRHDQPSSSTPQRDINELEICNQGKKRVIYRM
ncbi:MAG: hypothetical protein Q9191_005435 [Dirinaria sp. TL-2023a]